MTLYSQRDSRWNAIKLGYGTTTIGSYGCTITALAQLLLINGHNETPATVNDKLKANAGFVGTNQNLLVWAAIERAFKAKHIKRAYSYNNTEVADAISKYGGCMVEVDGTRIGAPTHWVLYIGNQRMIDPWTGVEKATNYYPAKGYSVISVEKVQSNSGTMQYKGLDLTNQDSMKVAVDVWADVRDGKYITSGVYQGVLTDLNAEKDRYKGLQSEYSEFIREIVAKLKPSGMLPDVTDRHYALQLVEELVTSESDLRRSLKEKEDELVEKERAWKAENKELKSRVIQLEQEVNELLDDIKRLKDDVQEHNEDKEDINSIKAFIETIKRLIWRTK